MRADRAELRTGSAEALRFHLFPAIFLLVVQLAGQGVYRNVVLRAELPPQDESQIILAGRIRDRIIDWWWLLLPLSPVHDFLNLPASS